MGRKPTRPTCHQTMPPPLRRRGKIRVAEPSLAARQHRAPEEIRMDSQSLVASQITFGFTGPRQTRSKLKPARPADLCTVHCYLDYSGGSNESCIPRLWASPTNSDSSSVNHTPTTDGFSLLGFENTVHRGIKQVRTTESSRDSFK